MKKIFLILAVLMLAAPVMAEPNNITITATVVDSDFPAEVEITYEVTSGKIARAFALDITVDAGTIVDIGGFFVGECNDTNGYGIFPANFRRYINNDFNNWDNVNYTPVAHPCDLPGGTEGGIGTNGVTIEMGSLYDASEGKGPPEDIGTLCSIWVSDDCHVDLALNVGRAGIVMEDGNSPDDMTLTECDVTVVCTVPLVVGDVNVFAQGVIFGAGFGIGDITTACSDTIADGNVISTDPAAGVATCGADVNIVVSTGVPCCPAGDITGTVTGYHPPTPFDPAYFDVNDWTGSNGQIDTTDVQALNYLLIWMGTDLVVTPVPSAAAGGDVTGTVTGYHPPTPFDPAYFDVNDWTGPDGKIDTTDVQALNYLLIWMGTDLVFTCP